MRLRIYRKRRRGVASVLGILIMVGILMTSILPTFIYINEVNNYYDRTVVDLKISDDDRNKENLEIHGYGNSNTSIDVFFINRSPLAINITRIWVMRTDLKYTWIFNSPNDSDLPLWLGASEQVTLNLDFEDILDNNSDLKRFAIEVATERGNKFSSETNPLEYSDVSGWQTGTSAFKIQVIILSDPGQDRYFIEINGLNETHYDWIDSATIQGQFFCIFDVPQAGKYNITVQNTRGQDYPVGNATVILTWLHPNSFNQFDDS